MLLVCKSSRNKTVSLGAKSTFPFGGPPLYPINSYSSRLGSTLVVVSVRPLPRVCVVSSLSQDVKSCVSH